MEELFDRFGQHLKNKGYIARGGQIIDATIVSVPKQHNTKEENGRSRPAKRRRNGTKPAKNAQKDKDARWTKKNDRASTVTRTISAWTRRTNWSANGMRRTRPCTTVRSSTMCSISATPARRSGRTAPIARWQIEAGLKEKGCRAVSTGAPHAIVRCQSAEVGEHDALEGARPCRARIRPPAELDGRQDRAHHRHRAGEVQDRNDEPRLQHPPAGSARADGGCARLSALTGGVRVASCKGPRVARQASKRSRSGIHLGTSATTARSAKAEITEKRVLFEVP